MYVYSWQFVTGFELTCSFVAVLFIDALQRMVRIAQEGAVAKRNPEVAADVRTETTLWVVDSDAFANHFQRRSPLLRPAQP